MPDSEMDRDAVQSWEAPGPLEPRVLPEGAEADRVAAAQLMLGRYGALLAPPVSSPWHGTVRDGMSRAHDTAGAMLRFGYGEGEDQIAPFQVGFARQDLADAIEALAGGHAPREAAVELVLELARTVYDLVAAPADTALFDAACTLADRLGGERERALRERDLAEPATAREAGRTASAAAMWDRDAAYAAAFADRVRDELRARGHHFGTLLTGMTIPVSEEGLDLVREIVAAMAARFRISDEEALTRVTAYFTGWDLTDESDAGDLDHIGHQTPAEWAGSIYLGLPFHEVQPDADLTGRTPRPLP